MTLRIRKQPLHRRGRDLDADRPLYVTRRLPTGGETFLPPGTVFERSSVSKVRLERLFRGRYVGHDLPHGVKPIEQLAPAEVANEGAPAATAPPPDPAPKPQPPRIRARS